MGYKFKKIVLLTGMFLLVISGKEFAIKLIDYVILMMELNVKVKSQNCLTMRYIENFHLYQSMFRFQDIHPNLYILSTGRKCALIMPIYSCYLIQ